MVIIIDYIAEGFKEAIGLLIGFDKEVYGIITLSLIVSTTATVVAALICVPLGIHLGLKDCRTSCCYCAFEKRTFREI